jgi:RHS repeat-associated protein
LGVFLWCNFDKNRGAQLHTGRNEHIARISECDCRRSVQAVAFHVFILNVRRFCWRSGYTAEYSQRDTARGDEVNGSDAIYTYQQFARQPPLAPPTRTLYEFTGRENDATGLYYYRARYYSPTFQRFVSQDPIGFRGGDVDLYRYEGNSPLNYRDPKGTGPIASGVVLAACSLYNFYDITSFFGQTAQLEAQILQIQQQIQDLNNRRCPFGTNPDEYDLRRQKVIDDLQTEIFQLTKQYAAENSSNVIGGIETEAACAAAAGLAVLLPEP